MGAAVGAARRTGRAAATLLAAVAVVVAVPATASAGGPGQWTTVSANPVSGGYPRTTLLDEPSVVRWGSDLMVVWRVDAAAGAEGLQARVLGADGRARTGVTPVVSGWRGLLEDPRALVVAGRPTVVFSGRRADAGDPFSAGAPYVTDSADAVAWSLRGSPLSNTAVYDGYGFDAVDDGAVLVAASNVGASLRWHRGFASAGAADRVLDLPDCCTADVALARDRVTGEVFTAFSATGDRADVVGIHVLRILPSATAATRVPRSATASGGAVGMRTPDQRLALAARVGGGVWLAFAQGYPDVTNIRLYDVRSGRSVVVPDSAGARDISLAAAPGGRLWVTWVDPSARTVRAVRTDTNVTRFGPVRALAAPAGHGTIWKTAADGSLGPLDVVVTGQRSGTGALNLFHQQVLPALTPAFARKVLVSRAGVRYYPITVADAGQRVSGVTVRLRGRAVGVTNATGAAYVPIARGVRGTFTVTVARAGYAAGVIALRVR